MITVSEARSSVLSACRALVPTRMAACETLGHVLAETIRAATSVPPFANSAMDGSVQIRRYRLPAGACLRVVGTVMAGSHRPVTLLEGESVRIMTGAPLPAGADAVCMVERASSDDGGSVVVIGEAMSPGTNVRLAGYDIAPGDEVFGPGRRLDRRTWACSQPWCGSVARLPAVQK